MRSLTHTLRSRTCFGFFFVVLRKNCARDASVEREGERARTSERERVRVCERERLTKDKTLRGRGQGLAGGGRQEGPVSWHMNQARGRPAAEAREAAGPNRGDSSGQLDRSGPQSQGLRAIGGPGCRASVGEGGYVAERLAERRAVTRPRLWPRSHRPGGAHLLAGRSRGLSTVLPYLHFAPSARASFPHRCEAWRSGLILRCR